ISPASKSQSLSGAPPQVNLPPASDPPDRLAAHDVHPCHPPGGRGPRGLPWEGNTGRPVPAVLFERLRSAPGQSALFRRASATVGSTILTPSGNCPSF